MLQSWTDLLKVSWKCIKEIISCLSSAYWKIADD